MSSGPSRPFVSVKFSPVGRTYSFLLPELALDSSDQRRRPSPGSVPRSSAVELRATPWSCRPPKGARSAP